MRGFRKLRDELAENPILQGVQSRFTGKRFLILSPKKAAVPIELDSWSELSMIRSKACVAYSKPRGTSANS